MLKIGVINGHWIIALGPTNAGICHTCGAKDIFIHRHTNAGRVTSFVTATVDTKPSDASVATTNQSLSKNICYSHSLGTLTLVLNRCTHCPEPGGRENHQTWTHFGWVKNSSTSNTNWLYSHSWPHSCKNIPFIARLSRNAVILYLHIYGHQPHFHG